MDEEPSAPNPLSSTRAVLPALDTAFELALASHRNLFPRQVILFSGGVDSSLLAWELRSLPAVRLFTVGVDGSPDLRSARTAAGELGLPWEGHVVDPAEIRRAGGEVRDRATDLGATDLSVLATLALALAHAPPGALLCGQGVDELFGGYSHFRGLGPEAAARRSAADLDKLLRRDWPRTLALAGRLHRTLDSPYLDPRFVAAVQRVPASTRLTGSVPKERFREWARHRGLPADLADRPKRAMQYGSGVDRVLRRER